MTIVLCLILWVVPVLAVRILHRGVPGTRYVLDAVHRHRHRHDPPFEQRVDFEHELGRLVTHHGRLRAAGFEGADQLAAVERAYDQVLCSAGRALAVDGATDLTEVDEAVRLHLETELLGRGLRW